MYHFHANWLYFFFHPKIIFVSLFIFNGFLFIFCYISSLNLATDHICLMGSNMIFLHIFHKYRFYGFKKYTKLKFPFRWIPISTICLLIFRIVFFSICWIKILVFHFAIMFTIQISTTHRVSELSQSNKIKWFWIWYAVQMARLMFSTFWNADRRSVQHKIPFFMNVVMIVIKNMPSICLPKYIH